MFKINFNLFVSIVIFSLVLSATARIPHSHVDHNLKSLKSFLSKRLAYGKNPLIEQFATGIQLLMDKFNTTSGVWDDPKCLKPGSCINGVGWWYWGNAAHILADYQKFAAAGHKDYSWAFDPLLKLNREQMTSSEYFDDEGWWGLALLRFYEATNNTIYLNQAKKIADDMKNRGQQSLCGGSGGIFWDASRTQVGAIANELFISLSAKIALIDDPNGVYKKYALDAWNWLNTSGLISATNTIYDHYAIVNKSSCGSRVDWTFTYTSGVILSGLVDLAKLTGDLSYLEKANRIAKVAISRFAPNGIINDDYSGGNPKSLAEDGLLFKGIFVDNLSYLAQKTKDLGLKAEISALLTSNYGLLIYNQGSGKIYSYLWEKPVGDNNPGDIVTHLSALYLLDSVIQLKNMQKST